jgi:predicted MFS family arabinose efflux permease
MPDSTSEFRWFHIVIVFFPFATGYFLSYLFRTVNGPIADQLMDALGLDTGRLGLLTSVYFLTFAICQLPYGPLVDRFGPRRVQGTVLMIAVAGAVLFGVAQNVPTLIVARALIGIGTSGALMAGLKALAVWVPQERRTLANGCFIVFGGLGAMSSTVPVTLLLPMLGWRGVFLVLAGVTLASAVLVLLIVPEKAPATPAENWRSSLRGLVAVYGDPAFWRLAPLSACVIGTAFAVHGLWAARWLAEVDHFAPDRVASVVFAMGAGLTVGAAVIGLLSDLLRRCGVQPGTTFGLACALFMGLQLVTLDRLAVPAWLLWGTIGAFGSMTVLSYSIIGEMFPPDRIGRANGALNVLHLGMAFVLQYGMGEVASFWSPDPSGHLPVIAYRAAFLLPLLLEFVALAWFGLSSAVGWHASHGLMGQPELASSPPAVNP